MKRLACHADCCPARRVYRGAVKKQKRYSALKLPIAVDSQTAMFAYIDPGNETASGLGAPAIVEVLLRLTSRSAWQRAEVSLEID